MVETEREWSHKTWAAMCPNPNCNKRRMLWPATQNVSSLDDPKCKFVHIETGMKECEGDNG